MRMRGDEMGVIQGSKWDVAFDGAGFGHRQSRLSRLVRKHLELDGAVDIPTGRPTDDQLRLCFPRRTHPPSRALWRAFEGPRAVMLSAAVERGRGRGRGRAPGRGGGAAAGSSTDGVGPARPQHIGARVVGRTRSETARLTSAADEAHAPRAP